MPLETASHIAELNAANPVGSADFISEGDNQIRMIKQVLTTDLGRIAGPVSANQTELSATAYLPDTGVADAMLAAPNPAWTNYGTGCGLWVKVAAANTGPVTINVSGLGVKSIKRPDGTDLQAGDIAAGAIVGLRYDGTQFQLMTGSTVLTQTRADARYLQSGGMKTYQRLVDTAGTGEWLKIARIQSRNPIDAAESSLFSGFAFVQSDYRDTADGQSLFQFSFGVRGNAIKPVCVQMGDNFGGNKFAIYRENDGWYYLYLYRGINSKSLVIQYQAFECTEYFAVQAPVGTLIWDSVNNGGQALSNGKNLIWDDATAKLPAEIPFDYQNGWAPYGSGYKRPGYYKDRFGFVHLVGLLRPPSGGAGSGAVFATLQAGFRPVEEEILVTDADNRAAQIRVRVNGEIMYGYSGGIVSQHLVLTGCYFRAYQ